MRFQSALLLAIAVLAAGCAKPEAQVIGKWQVDPASISSGDPKADAMAKSFASAMTMEFKADKTYTGPMMEGTYTMSGHTITMTTTKVMGMDVSKLGAQGNNKPQAATLSDDGKTITVDAGGKPMKFVKSS